ncbi:hypothetical protein KUV26_03895 [Leisingera daeponensis]|uniref:DUF995 domain-containing protein n=1 Tax=Leisingera daeponensis TaxID=405746 RepID=A0ABS7NBI8_9RHOB|nr:hypothetical protein [Leisingera daeponensis]MBY6138568.1 hypothetical protein [Leisingera daeponensis]
MRQFALMIALSSAVSPVSAGEWQRLSGDEVQAALEGRRLVYGSGAWQEFSAFGRTLYNAGRDSWGYWGVRDGKYCSSWPPLDLWACYALESDGDAVRFIGESGGITTGRYHGQ